MSKYSGQISKLNSILNNPVEYELPIGNKNTEVNRDVEDLDGDMAEPSIEDDSNHSSSKQRIESPSSPQEENNSDESDYDIKDGKFIVIKILERSRNKPNGSPSLNNINIYLNFKMFPPQLHLMKYTSILF